LDFFIQKISPELVTIILNDLAEFPLLKDTSGYLAVKLVMKSEQKSSVLGLIKKAKPEVRYAIIEIPKNTNRIVELPNKDGKQYLIMLDDLIRYNLSSIFISIVFTHLHTTPVT
jgi:polyphosphate kinase